MTKRLLLAAVLAAALPVMAQKAPAPAAASAAAPASPAKKALIAKVLQLQQPALEGLARQLAEQPAVMLAQQAMGVLQRLPEDKREPLGKELQNDLRKYAEETTPIVRDRAIKLAPSTIGVLLDQRFTEEELKQLVAILESPVNRKYQGMSMEMQRAIGEKLVAETKPLIEPKGRALEQSMRKRFEAAGLGGGAASAPAGGNGNGTKK